MSERYNIYFAGEILQGHDPDRVRAGLAKLFKADEKTLDLLFSGDARLIKRDCDKATALKYKQAMERAGAKPRIKAGAGGEAGAAPPGTAEKAPDSAGKIAALAAADDVGKYGAAPAPTAPPLASGDDDSLALCPDGTEVLRPHERPAPVVAQIDTTGLEVAEAGLRLSEEKASPGVAPDTSHLAMGEVGETIPNLPRESATLDPDTSALDLSPAGTDFSDCATPEATAPELDLSGIAMAPPGAEVLTEAERKRPSHPPPPETGHISLSE